MANQVSVVAFSGHMIDAPTRPTPRFPPSRIDYVRSELRERLAQRQGELIGVCSAADGSDILFGEEVLAREGRLVIHLPFDAQAFQETSVKSDWRERFERLLSSSRVDVRPPLYAQLPPTEAEQNRAFAQVNEAIIASAESLASTLGDPDPWFLAVYQQAQANKEGGTGDAFRAWTRKGRKLVTIDPMGDAR